LIIFFRLVASLKQLHQMRRLLAIKHDLQHTLGVREQHVPQVQDRNNNMPPLAKFRKFINPHSVAGEVHHIRQTRFGIDAERIRLEHESRHLAAGEVLAGRTRDSEMLADDISLDGLPGLETDNARTGQEVLRAVRSGVDASAVEERLGGRCCRRDLRG
jgi:hypothetical protein